MFVASIISRLALAFGAHLYSEERSFRSNDSIVIIVVANAEVVVGAWLVSGVARLLHRQW